ncbi:MAG: hypothetical protein WCG95_00050 [bacterium]
MVDVQRGDDRQYFENFKPENDYGVNFQTTQSALNSGISIAQQANQSKLANYQVDVNNKLQTENDRINTKYQQDPANPERQKEFDETADSIFASYEINPLMQKQWGDVKNSVKNNYSTYNNEWIMTQQKTNAQVDLKNAVTSSLESAGMQKGDFNASRVKLDFSNNYNAIKTAALPILGQVTTDEMLKDYQHDFITMRLSKQIDDNPALAMKLLNDDKIKNDIGRLETIDSLKGAAQQKLEQRNKETALNNVANLIVSKGDIGNKIMDGTMSTAELQSVTRKLHPNERDIVWGMAGYSTSQKFMVDRTSGAIKYHNEGGGGGGRKGGNGGFSVSKLPASLKQNYLAGLEIRGANLLNFSPEEQGQMKSAKGNQSKHDMTSGFLGMVKDYQDEVNAAYNSGLITKDDVKRLQGNYVNRVAGYVQENVKGLSENSGLFWRNKTGYDGLKESFRPASGATKKQKETSERELGKATIAYFSSLENLAKKNGLNNVYDIEKLDSEKQKQIYKQAQEQAMVRTKSYTNNPSYWIQRDHPSQYSRINNALTKKDARAAAGMFINEIVKSPEMKYDEQNHLTNHIIKSTIDKNRETARSSVSNALKAKSNPLDTRAKKLNVSMNDVNGTAKKYGMTPQQVLTKLEMSKR